MTKEERRYFLIYSTANEEDYLIDYVNILRMTNKHPGVDRVEVIVVVSCVNNKSDEDNAVASIFKRMIDQCPWLVWKGAIFKPNVGRDFSSTQWALKEISKYAMDEDIVMVRNRSAYGPFFKGWFVAYLELMISDRAVGLVGNTINQSGHQDSQYDEETITCHIQTYLYLTEFGILKPLIDYFPGALEVDRMELINKGEIQLSREVMSRGLYLRCLIWPNYLFGGQIYNYPELFQSDIKYQILGLPFEHRHSKIPYASKLLKYRWKWNRLLQKFRSRLKN